MTASFFKINFELLEHKSSNILESTPLIGSSLAGKISNKINSSEADKDSANSTAKSCVLEYKCG